MADAKYGYPLNVIVDFVKPELTEAEIAKLSADKSLADNWSYALDVAGVDERSKKMIELYYKNDLSFGKIGERYGVTAEGARQIVKRNLVNNIGRFNEDVMTIVMEGAQEYKDKKMMSLGYDKAPGHIVPKPVKTLPEGAEIPDISVYDLDISSRLRNVLLKANIKNLRDLMYHDPTVISSSRNIGKKTFAEFVELMEKYGVMFNKESFEELNKTNKYKDYKLRHQHKL